MATTMMETCVFVRYVCVIRKGKAMSLGIRKLIVRLRMWYADIRGHHGKRWNYEPGDHYMGMNRRKNRK